MKFLARLQVRELWASGIAAFAPAKSINNSQTPTHQQNVQGCAYQQADCLSRLIDAIPQRATFSGDPDLTCGTLRSSEYHQRHNVAKILVVPFITWL